MIEAIEKPDHYTDEDMEMVAKLNDFLAEQDLIEDKAKRISQANLARMARVAPATFSQALRLKYPTSPTRQLRTALDAIHNLHTDHDLSKTRETSVYNMVIAVCKNAREQRNFGIVSGYVGLGKTHAIKNYQAQHSNTFLIEVDPTLTQKAMLESLELQVVGRKTSGSVHDKVSSVIDSLKDTDSLLIFDEAETLTDKPLHLIRRIRDMANVGVVLVGTEYLASKITPEHGTFDQIRSRVGFWPATMRGLKFEDVEALTEAYLGEAVDTEAQQELWAVSGGSARMLTENLIPNIIKFRPQFAKQSDGEGALPAITQDMVRKVARDTLQISTNYRRA